MKSRYQGSPNPGVQPWSRAPLTPPVCKMPKCNCWQQEGNSKDSTKLMYLLLLLTSLSPGKCNFRATPAWWCLALSCEAMGLMQPKIMKVSGCETQIWPCVDFKLWFFQRTGSGMGLSWGRTQEHFCSRQQQQPSRALGILPDCSPWGMAGGFHSESLQASNKWMSRFIAKWWTKDGCKLKTRTGPILEFSDVPNENDNYPGGICFSSFLFYF